MSGGYELRKPAGLTCPDCGGTLEESRVGAMPYFTCHIGHRYGADDMEDAEFRQVERALGAALRSLNERGALCARMVDAARAEAQHALASRWEEARLQAMDRAEQLRIMLEDQWVRPPLDAVNALK